MLRIFKFFHIFQRYFKFEFPINYFYVFSNIFLTKNFHSENCNDLSRPHFCLSSDIPGETPSSLQLAFLFKFYCNIPKNGDSFYMEIVSDLLYYYSAKLKDCRFVFFLPLFI